MYYKKDNECDAQGNGGYNVVPKEVDPHNAYTLEKVRTYLLDHLDMLLDSAQIETGRTRVRDLGSVYDNLVIIE